MKDKRSLTYTELHNKYVKSFSKCTLFLVFIGFANLVGLVIFYANLPRTLDSLVAGFFLNYVLIITIPNPLVANIVFIILSLSVTAFFIMAGLLAPKGHYWPLIAGGAVYLLDSLIPIYIFSNYISYGTVLLGYLIHLSFLGGIALAFYYRKRIIMLAKQSKVIKKEEVL